MSGPNYYTARRDGLVIQPLDGELLVSDGDKTHLLNPVAASVWQSCDGHHSIADLSRQLAMDESTVTYALQQLEQKQLLQSNPAALALTKPITRREFLKKSALAAAAIPVIKTIQAPNPQAPVSCLVSCAASPTVCGPCPCVNGCCIPC